MRREKVIFPEQSLSFSSEKHPWKTQLRTSLNSILSIRSPQSIMDPIPATSLRLFV